MANITIEEIKSVKEQLTKDYIKIVLKHGFSKLSSKLEREINYYEQLESHVLSGLNVDPFIL